MGRIRRDPTFKKRLAQAEREWDLSIERELALINKVKKYKEGGPEKQKIESDEAWEELAACHLGGIRDFFEKKMIDPLLADKLAAYTMKRARRSIISGRYKPEIRRLKIYIKAVTARGVLTGFRKEGEKYIEKIIPAANLRGGRGQEKDDTRDPIEDAPDPKKDTIKDAENELAKVVFSIGGKPHRLIVFGFVKVLNWEKQAFLEQLLEWLLGRLGKKFCRDYYMDSFHTLDVDSFNRCYCGGLLQELEKTVWDVYMGGTDNLEKYYKMRVGKVPMEAFFGGVGPPSAVIDRWVHEVRARVRDAYALG